jgi:hypothetical protein
MGKEGETMHRRFRMQNQAVAGVIEALLMVALVAIVISMIQLIYIPQVMEQKESEHMDLVSNQISSLKSMIDLQAMTQSSAPISSMVTLGSRDLPYFITVKAFGTLSTDENFNYKIMMNPPPNPGLPQEFSANRSTIPLTSIKYEADNSYFVDQTYILEGGGLIVKQSDGTPVMRASPSISVENKTKIMIHFNLPYIIAIPGKNMTSGEGNCFIRTNYSTNATYYYDVGDSSEGGGSYIRIYTQYPTAWNKFLNDTLGMFTTGTNPLINIIVSPSNSYIEISPGAKGITLELNIITIFVQIGQGWVD